jgi:hypothetical protein
MNNTAEATGTTEKIPENIVIHVEGDIRWVPEDDDAADVKEFLDHVLGAQGFICIFALTPEGPRQFFYTDTDTASTKMVELDRAEYDVFIALGRFRYAASRTAPNVLNIKVVAIDVDVGPGKPYSTITQAASALVRFVKAPRLPAPLVVHSGHGLHVYWVMTEEMTPGEYGRVAGKLKRATARQGFHDDPSRAADISSVLRAPGTHNRKREPKRVRILKRAKPTSLAEFEAALDTYLARRVPDISINDDLSAGTSAEPWFPRLSDADKDACLKALLAHPPIAALADTSDADPTPNWRTVLAACARSGAPNAREICRTWAMNSARYREADFDTRFSSFED